MRIPFALERVTLLVRIPFALERVTLLVRIPFSWRGWPTWCESHSLLRRGILWSESHLLWRGKPLEENLIHLEKEKGTPLKRIPFAVERGGGPLMENPIHLEKRATWTGWTPLWSESYSHWRRGPPWCRAHSWASGVAKVTSLMRTASGVAKVIAVKIPVFRRRESPWTGPSTVARRVARDESIRKRSCERQLWRRWPLKSFLERKRSGRGPRPRC